MIALTIDEDGMALTAEKKTREGRRLCISDFFAAKNSEKMDVIEFSLMTIGAKASVQTRRDCLKAGSTRSICICTA